MSDKSKEDKRDGALEKELVDWSQSSPISCSTPVNPMSQQQLQHESCLTQVTIRNTLINGRRVQLSFEQQTDADAVYIRANRSQLQVQLEEPVYIRFVEHLEEENPSSQIVAEASKILEELCDNVDSQIENETLSAATESTSSTSTPTSTQAQAVVATELITNARAVAEPQSKTEARAEAAIKAIAEAATVATNLAIAVAATKARAVAAINANALAATEIITVAKALAAVKARAVAATEARAVAAIKAIAVDATEAIALDISLAAAAAITVATTVVKKRKLTKYVGSLESVVEKKIFLRSDLLDSSSQSGGED